MSAADRYLTDVAGVVRGLRQVADDLARHAEVGLDLHDMLPDHGRHVADVVHKVATMVPNLHLDSLVRCAADADREVRS